MAAQTKSLVAFAHVADVERSIRFYSDLGFLRDPDGYVLMLAQI